ncbi:MAG: class I SAM-dependent methyltransferase [bacterium]
MKKLHKNLKPNFYLEIGIFKGRSYKLSTCESIGIDPDPKVDYDSIYRITSDEFFLNHSDVLKNKTIDLSYIDGMHLFEYVLRDFINVEKYCNKQSVIIIDDVFPVHYKQAERVRQIRRP